MQGPVIRLGGGEKARLLRVARAAMVERGFEPDLPKAALVEADAAKAPAAPFPSGVRDLRSLPWCSIDNDDSRDLDQLSVAEGTSRILIAVADVAATVRRGSAADTHAATNTTTVYTPPQNFPMLPERLSTDLTSLNPDADRMAVVIEVDANGTGSTEPHVYRAVVRNGAKLTYRGVGPWLEGRGSMPEAIGRVPGLEENLRLQDRLTQTLRSQRRKQGALDLESNEVRARVFDDEVVGLDREERNRAKDLIEDCMIAANGVIARFLEGRKLPILRRVLRTPERWERIVDIAEDAGDHLPAEADANALQEFLTRRRAADPANFPDLSLSVIKLLGRGEYVASFPGEEVPGHFGLAVSDYTHSTAPNRRFPDLVTQRLVHAALESAPLPYERTELETLAAHCTKKADDAQKVERLMRKAAAACYLSDRIGAEFDGIVTGASSKGTYARIFEPPVEGRIEQGQQGLDVGDRVRVRLVHTDPERGFIDFARVDHRPVGRRRN